MLVALICPSETNNEIKEEGGVGGEGMFAWSGMLCIHNGALAHVKRASLIGLAISALSPSFVYFVFFVGKMYIIVCLFLRS